MRSEIFAMNVAVTGANGLVGSHLIKMLLKKDVNVKAFVRSNRAKLELTTFLGNDNTKNLQFVFGDILNKESIDNLVHGVDIIYHTAAYVSFNPHAKKQIYNTNIIGTKNIVNTLLKKENCSTILVYLSSVAAIGDAINEEIVNENHFLKNNEKQSHYGKSKYLAELEVWRGIEEGLNAVILNPAIILGNANSGKSSSALLQQMAFGLPFITDGTTGYVSVNDVCRAAIILSETDKKSQRYILCSENLSYQKLFEMVQKSLNKKRKPRFINKNILWIISLLNEISAWIFNLSPKLTRQIVKSGFEHSRFEGEKIVREIGFQYSDLQVEIDNMLNPSNKNEQ
ncbi:MAG TPA: NAD-dependent epimerase/dehydratase family protein [Salinivirgaceae bacterium]|nr:NAD-dependent epimerase/dehydratase family protein [Salinivirgaceae bacterium]HQA76493.1 NAD-dependent epimerase/dehydratase family protein [Salinivirgaceae bacterium]